MWMMRKSRSSIFRRSNIRESVTITSVMYSDVSDTDKRKEAAAEEEYQSQSVTPRVGLSRRRRKK